LPYVTINDVRNAAPQFRFGQNSRPGEAEINLIIQRVEASVDITFKSLGFETPITGPGSLLIVRKMVIDEVLAQTIEQQYAGVHDPKTFGSELFHQRYIDAVKALVDPNDPFTLPDAVKLDVQAKLEGELASLLSYDPASFGILDDDERITRDQVF
jgi:hypothetical protein